MAGKARVNREDAGAAVRKSAPSSESLSVPVVGGSGRAELPAELFDAQTNVPLIHQVVVAQLAAARQGTASTKTRGDVSGGGAKPWRQKGTGRARQGSRRAPQWVGGGVVHGPHPRDYSQRTPKKMIAAALRGALSDRAREGRVHVVESIVAGETPSTKAALKALAEIGVKKLLVVLDRDEDVAWLSLRNVPTLHALAVDQLNAYDVLVSDDVVFTAAALETFVAGPARGKVMAAPEQPGLPAALAEVEDVWPFRKRKEVDPDPLGPEDPPAGPDPEDPPPAGPDPEDPPSDDPPFGPGRVAPKRPQYPAVPVREPEYRGKSD